jgi:hypothetical protein
MDDGKLTEDARALSRDAKQRAALVDTVDGAREKAFALGAVYKFDCAVVLEAEALSGVGDGDLGAVRRAGYLQEKLMLLRLQSCTGCGSLTEMEKAAQLVAEIGEGAEKREIGIELFYGVHIYIVSRHINDTKIDGLSGRGRREANALR